MSPVDAALVRRKLARIAASLDALRPLAQLSLPEYESLDDAKVLASMGELLAQYPSYVQAVESYLTKAGA